MALEIKSEIFLDVKQRNIQKIITAHQYDKNSRYILAHIIDDGEPLDISKYDVMFKVHTQDDRCILSDQCTKQYETGDVVIELTESLLCSSGKHEAELVIYNDTTTLTTMKFTLIVEGSVYDDERLLSSDDFSAIRNLIDDIEGLENTMADISTLQDRTEQINHDYENAMDEMDVLRVSIQDKIDEVDGKVQELEDSVDDANDLIQEFRTSSSRLAQDVQTAEDLITQVGDIVEDDTMVRKSQLGVSSNEYSTGVATLDENAKLTESQFPYEFLQDSEIDGFINACLGNRSIKLDGVTQTRNLNFITVEDETHGRTYLLL